MCGPVSESCRKVRDNRWEALNSPRSSYPKAVKVSRRSREPAVTADRI